jgi:hypothetical protein
MIAAGLVALVFVYYYFPARLHREAVVSEQASRQLANYADLIQNRVLNYASVIKQWATNKENQTGKTNSGLADQVPELHYEKLAKAVDGLSAGVLTDDHGQIQVSLQYGPHRARIALDKLVTEFVEAQQDDLFDEVLIANNRDGSVLYQTRRTGLRFRTVPTGAQPAGPAPSAESGKAEGGQAEKASATSRDRQVDTVSVAGSPYRLYSSPLPIRLDRPDIIAALDWTIYGMVSESGMRAHVLGTPGSVLLTVALTLFLVLIAAWPALKFATMRAGERVPRRAGLYYLATTVLALVLCMMLAIHLWSLNSDFDRTDQKLSSLADAMDRNLTAETRGALNALHGAMRSSFFLSEASRLNRNAEPCGTPHDASKESAIRAIPDLLARTDVNLAGYPFFDQIFWTDRNGFQQMKWSVRPETTPAVRLCDFTLFTETLENHVWYFKEQLAGDKFRIDPIYSPNTGKYNAVVSQQSPWSVKNGQEVIAMGSVVTLMLSLIDPVLPPEYGFAVVDASGQVLFHSTSVKDGREQLAAETDYDPKMLAALSSGLGNYLTANYHGRDHRFFVRPLAGIQGSNWVLVTFRDLSTRRMMQLERMLLFMILTAGYLLLLGAAPALRLRIPDYPPAWVWPQPGSRALYLYLAGCLLLMAVLLYVLVIKATLWIAVLIAVAVPMCSAAAVIGRLREDWAWIAVLGAAVAIAALLVTAGMYFRNYAGWSTVGPLLLSIGGIFFLISSNALPERLSKNPRLPGCQSSYTALAVSFVVMLAIVPCLGFFRVAYAFYDFRFTERTQLETMAALEAREERIRQSYKNVNLTGSDGRLETVAKALFLRSRIDDQSLDRYDRVFVANGETEYSAETYPWPLPPVLDRLANLWPYAAASGTRQLAGANSRNARWEWVPEGSNRLRMRPLDIDPLLRSSEGSPPTAALARLVTHDPVLLSEDIVSELQARWQAIQPIYLFAGLGFLVLVFFWIRRTVGQMFILNVEVRDSWPKVRLDSIAEIDHNFVLVGLPCSHKSQKIKELEPQGVLRIDLSQFIPEVLASPEPQAYQQHTIDKPIIALDHFEYRCEDPEVNRIKLELLEWLTHLGGKKIAIFTTIDPTYYLGGGLIDDIESPEGFAPGRYLDRWVFLMAAFRVRSLDLHHTAQSDQYYRLLWATCSRSERVALHQLARDGWPNHRNWRALDHLRKRGLILRRKNSPVWEIYDPLFRKHIRDSVNKKTLTAWQSGEATTAIDGFRIGAGILASGVVIAVLLYNQQQILAAIAAGVSALAPLAKLLAGAREQAREGASKGGDSE